MAVSAFASTLVIAVRESLEAFLIVGILSGMATKLGQPGARKHLAWGALLGLLASVAAGVAVVAGAHEAIKEGGETVALVATLLALGILTYMVVWMYRHTIQLVGSLHDKTKAALAAGKPAALGTLAFIAVVREGVEAAAFIATTGGRGLQVVLGVVVGLLASAILAAVIFSGLLKLSIERFFLVTGILLVLFGGYLVGHGLGEILNDDYHLGVAAEAACWVAAVLYVLALLAYLLQPFWRKKAQEPSL